METLDPTLSDDRGDAPGTLRHVEEFANTLDVESGADDLRTPEDAARWLRARPELAAPDPRPRAVSIDGLATLRRLRAALRDALRANHDGPAQAGAYAEMNAIAAGVPLQLCLDPAAGARLEPRCDDAASFAAGRVLAAVYDAVADGSWNRLKICPADTCQWVFYDRSRNRSGTWCSMRVCGNRAKVRRYQQRLRGKGREDA